MSAIALAERAKWVGSSESAILLGLSSYGTPFEIWHQKAGNIPIADLDGLERVEAGRFLEPAIAAWAADKWGWPLRKAEGYLAHPTVAGMGASLDWEEAGGEPDVAPVVEIKNVDGLIFRQEWQTEGDEVIDAPIKFLIQVQHQLACRPKAPHGWLLACVGGNRLYRMMVPRHAGTIARIERAVDHFWYTISVGLEPKPDFEADGDAIAALYAVDNGETVDLRGDNRLPVLCASYIEAKAREKAAAADADAARNEIRHIIGDASRALVNGFNVSASTVAEADVSYVRKAYRAVRITAKKEGAR